MELYFVFLDIGPNTGFLSDAIHNPFSLVAMLAAFCLLLYAVFPYFTPSSRKPFKLFQDKTRSSFAAIAVVILILVAILVK